MKRILVFTTLFLIAGCDSDPQGNTSIQSGEWSGFTFDSTAVSFSVTDNAVDDMTISFKYDLESPDDTTVTWIFDSNISDNQFQYIEMDGSGSWAFGLNMDGTFNPPDHVSGEVTTWATYTEGGSSGSDTLEMVWSASPD